MERVLLSPEFKESRICFDLLVDEILLDLCFEYHWRIKTGLLDRPHPDCDQSYSSSVTSSSSSITFVTSSVILCNICKLQVSGYRYAQHLEKCLNGNKRLASMRNKQMNQSSTSPASSSPSAISSSSLPQSKKKSRHSYGSLTVRIALKNGVPKPNQRRRTVPSSVFLTYSLAKASISPSLAISDQSINNEDDENEENSLDEQEYEDQGAI